MDFTNKEYEKIEDNAEKLSILKQRIQIVSDLILELSEYNQQIISNIGIVENIAVLYIWILKNTQYRLKNMKKINLIPT